jgi:hypothetical protein
MISMTLVLLAGSAIFARVNIAEVCGNRGRLKVADADLVGSVTKPEGAVCGAGWNAEKFGWRTEPG